MKKMMIGILAFSIVGCAHKVPSEKVVALPFAADLVAVAQQNTGRVPASFEFELSDEKSTRRVYFSSLYHQFLALGQFIKADSSLGSCPQFHHDKIETDGFITPAVPQTTISQVSEEQRVYFPELVFNRKYSLNDHHSSIKNELEILCEEGVSDNFYKFDNLVTHYAGKKSFHLKPEAMASVLKIPVFANYYLVKMLQGHDLGFQFSYPEEKRIFKMTNTAWFEKYVTEASRLRGTLLKTKLVRR